MAATFRDAFSSVYSVNPLPAPAEHQVCDSAICDIVVSEESVRGVLLGLDSSSSAGPDSLHPFLLKSCAEELTVPLSKIFAKSTSNGIIPDMWKISNIIPIYKKGVRSCALNYRPVSLTSVPCKIL